MKNLRKFLVFVLFAFATVFAFGIKGVKAADSVVCELDFTTKSSGSSYYDTTWTYGDWTVSGGANNNKGWGYVKMGGKSEKLIDDVYLSSPVVAQTASKVTVNVIAGSLPKAAMKLNSWGLYVYSDSAMTSQVDYVAGDTITNAAALFEFTPTSGTTWPANSYFKVDFDLANTSTTNGIIWLDNVSIWETQEDPKYTVTFDSNGGSEVAAYNDVVQGSKIVKPEDPTLNGYAFYGWYNGEDLWDFENDVVTENITLTAKWLNAALENAVTALNSVEAYMSMAFTYSYNTAVKADTLTYSSLELPSTSGYQDFEGVKDQSPAEYKGQACGNTSNYIQLRTSSNNSGIVSTVSGGVAKEVVLAWTAGKNDGKVVEVYGSNVAYTAATDLYGANKGTLLGTIDSNSTTLEITGEYRYVGIKSSSGALYLDSVEITWDSTLYTDADFRVKVAVDSSIADAVEGLALAATEYGIAVTDGEKTEYFAAANELVVEEDGKVYVVIDLGDVLNNKERITNELTVSAYFEYEETIYSSTSVKTYSVKTLVEEYLPMDIAEVNVLKSTLEALGYEFN